MLVQIQDVFLLRGKRRARGIFTRVVTLQPDDASHAQRVVVEVAHRTVGCNHQSQTTSWSHVSQHHGRRLHVSLVEQLLMLADELLPILARVGQSGILLHVVVTHHQTVQPCRLLHAPAILGTWVSLLVGRGVGHDFRHKYKSRQLPLLVVEASLVAAIQQLATLADSVLHILGAHYFIELVAGAWTSCFKES